MNTSKNQNTTETLKPHDLANIFPLLEEKDLTELAKNIQKNGQKETIKLLNGKIIDGRNRYKACLISGVKPRFKTIKTDKPLEYVVSLNIHRRHLNESQRAWVAAKIADTQICTQSDAAKLMNVSLRSVVTASTTVKNSTPELQDAVQNGKVAVSLASKLAKLDKKEQKRLLPLSKNEINKEIKAKKLAPHNDGKVRNISVPIHFAKDELKYLDSTIKKLNGGNREIFIRDVVLDYCRNAFPDLTSVPDFVKRRKAKHLQKSYSERDMKVGKSGISKEEADMAKEYEHFESSLPSSAQHISAEALDKMFDHYLQKVSR